MKYIITGSNTEKFLGWKERLEIAIDAAHGQPKFCAYLSSLFLLLVNSYLNWYNQSFGLSKNFAAYDDTKVAGTPGYMDPKYFSYHPFMHPSHKQNLP